MEKISITFTGDVCITGDFLTQYELGKPLFGDKLSLLLSQSDFVVTNFEGSETLHNEEVKIGTCLKNPINAISYLKKNNIGILNLANNHIMDYGEVGLYETLNAASLENVRTFGAAENEKKAALPLIIEKDGIKIALIACAHKEGIMASEKAAGVFSVKNMKQLKNAMIEAKKQVDFVIVNYHGGAEFNLYAIPSKRRLLKKLLDMGADIIISHHPHVVQAAEQVGEKIIFYSLGNFIFDWADHKRYSYTDIGLVVNINFTKNSFETNTFEVVSKNGCVELKKEGIFEKVSDLNDYAKKFEEDAFRIWNQRKASTKEFSEENDKGSNQSLFNKIRHYYALLNDESIAPIVRAAFMYKLKKKLGLLK